MYGFGSRSPAVINAAEFFFRYQTEDGDIRGILGSRYTPYYTAAIAELLIKSGYAEDDRIESIFAAKNSTNRKEALSQALPGRIVFEREVFQLDRGELKISSQ
jgi:hypothetical protein